MLFQKEKEDKNQINRLDQKKRKALSEKVFSAFPDEQETTFWKGIPVHLFEKGKSYRGSCSGSSDIFVWCDHFDLVYGYL